MPTIFCDWDGTAAKWGSEKFLPGALEKLLEFQKHGGQIVFTTQRQEFDASFDMEGMRAVIEKHFPSSPILYGLSSARIVINDAGAFAINHLRDNPWHQSLLNPDWFTER